MCQGVGFPSKESAESNESPGAKMARRLLQAFVREGCSERFVKKEHLLDRQGVAHEDAAGRDPCRADDAGAIVWSVLFGPTLGRAERVGPPCLVRHRDRR